MALPPENYYKIGPYLGVFQGIHTALDINEGIIKVVGPDGAGKSSFCHKLVEELKAQGQEVIYFEQPPESSDYLYEFIQSALGLDKSKNFNRALTRYLQETSANHKVVIIYNDAEKISKDLFILIRLLNNIHDHSSTLVSQVIVGTSKLDELFDDPALRSLTQYLNQSFTLSAMSRIDLDDFYTSYKNAHGITGKDMKIKQLTDLFMRSKGLPGSTTELLDNFFQAETVNPVDTIPEPDKTDRPDETVENDVTPDIFVDSGVVNNIESDPGIQTQEEPDYLQNLSLLPETEVAAEDDAPALDATDKDETREQQDQGGKAEQADSEPTADAETMQDIVLPPLGEPEAAEAPAASAQHVRELDEILEDASTSPVNRSRLYFKVALSVVVVISSMVLAILLSGGSDTANNRLAEVLAVDTPLYLDEISDNTSANPADSPNSPADPVSDQNTPAAGIPDERSSTSITMTVDDSVNVDAEDNEAQVPAVADDGASLITSDGQETVAQEMQDSEPVAENELVATAINENDIDQEVETIAATEEDIFDSIDTVISGWVAAWQEGRFEDYLAAYHKDFVPYYHESYELWLEQRRTRIQGVTGISLSFDRLEFIDMSEAEATVEFWLQYARGNYADDTHKQLKLKLDGDRWLILVERNLELVLED